MSLSSFGFKIDYYTAIVSASVLAILATHLVPYVVDKHRIRSIPGPWLAKFTDIWLGRVAAKGHRSEVVHEMHKRYGEFIFFCDLRIVFTFTYDSGLTHPATLFNRGFRAACS